MGKILLELMQQKMWAETVALYCLVLDYFPNQKSPLHVSHITVPKYGPLIAIFGDFFYFFLFFLLNHPTSKNC